MENTSLLIDIICGILGAAGVIASTILGISAQRRLRNKDAAAGASTETTLQVDVDYIKRGIDDIKTEQRRMYEDIRQLSDRMIRAEESVKSAHRRLDEHLSEKVSECEEPSNY